MLVRGRAGDTVPTSQPELGAVARLLGYAPDASQDLVQDYRRAARRARGRDGTPVLRLTNPEAHPGAGLAAEVRVGGAGAGVPGRAAAPTGTGSTRSPGSAKGRKVGHPRVPPQARPQAIRLTRNGFALHGQRLYVAKVGDLKVRWSRELPSVPSSVTVIRESDGRYYASFVVERDATPLPAMRPRDRHRRGSRVGLAVTSDGEVIANPRFLRRRAAASSRAQQSLSRKQKRFSEPGEGPAPGRGPPPQGPRRPARSSRIRRPSGWSATAKRSTPRTSPSPGWPGHGSRSPCTTPDGRSSCGSSGRRRRSHGRYFRTGSGASSRRRQVCSACGAKDGPKPLSVREWAVRDSAAPSTTVT